jgi:hypothetical protein
VGPRAGLDALNFCPELRAKSGFLRSSRKKVLVGRKIFNKIRRVFCAVEMCYKDRRWIDFNAINYNTKRLTFLPLTLRVLCRVGSLIFTVLL